MSELLNVAVLLIASSWAVWLFGGIACLVWWQITKEWRPFPRLLGRSFLLAIVLTPTCFGDHPSGLAPAISVFYQEGSDDWLQGVLSLLLGWLAILVVGLISRAEVPGSRIEDGTWTLNLPRRRHRDGVWVAWLDRESIVHPRFQRARFVLAEGPAMLISAADLRRALAEWLADPNGGDHRPFNINFEYNTVNGVPVEMSPGT